MSLSFTAVAYIDAHCNECGKTSSIDMIAIFVGYDEGFGADYPEECPECGVGANDEPDA